MWRHLSVWNKCDSLVIWQPKWDVFCNPFLSCQLTLLLFFELSFVILHVDVHRHIIFYFLWNRPIYFHYVYNHIIAHNMNIKWLNYFYWEVLASIANVCFRFEVCEFFLQYIGYYLLNLLWRLYFIHDLFSLKVTKTVYYFFMLYVSDKRNYLNFCFKKIGDKIEISYKLDFLLFILIP